jgi:hypothetical protein
MSNYYDNAPKEQIFYQDKNFPKKLPKTDRPFKN